MGSRHRSAFRFAAVVALSVGHGTNDPGQQLPLVQVRNYWYHWYFALSRGADLVKGPRRELGKFLWTTWSPAWRFAEADYAETAASFDNPDWATFDRTANFCMKALAVNAPAAQK